VNTNSSDSKTECEVERNRRVQVS